MAKLLLFSTNPWYSHHVSLKYNNGFHSVWCSEFYDPTKLEALSPHFLTAPSSCPKSIYDALQRECGALGVPDSHSLTIGRYRKKFKHIAKQWLSEGKITKAQHDDIAWTARSNTTVVWRPVLYIIPREPIEKAGRLLEVSADRRASFGPEWQIRDLCPDEFELIER